MIKLLDKPLRAFTTYAMVVLLCSIPVYFFIIDFIWVHELNKHNALVAETTRKNLADLKYDEQQLNSVIVLWNHLQPGTKIVKTPELKPDSTYNVYRKGKYSIFGNSDRFQGLVTYFSMNGEYYSLTVEANVEESYETIIAITLITILFFIILLVGFIQLNKRISKKLWNPFYTTLGRMRDFDLSSQQAISFDSTPIAEFEELNSSINKLIKSNVEVFRQQKEFTENASHELQTPLAIVQSKLDLLLQDPSLTSAQSEIIESTNYALSRVSRINKNLLLLAKIENRQFLDRQEIRMSGKLGEILDLLDSLFGEKVIRLEVQAEAVVNGNVILVEIMLTNLLMNALRHTSAEEKIEIVLSAKQLEISNQGSSELEKDKLFRRFSTASVHTPGSGLGLSIIEEICHQYGWTVSYSYRKGMHHFLIDFI